MIYIKFKGDETYYESKFKRINENVVSVISTKGASNNGFYTFAESGAQLGDFSNYTTVCKIDGYEIWYSNNNYVHVEPQPFVPREPTPDEIKQMLIDGVQNWMDEVAMSRGYDGILSACSYIDTGVERFDIEGAQARRWRSQVWAYCYAYLDEVLAGNRNIPSLEELIEELPKIDWLTE